jgi:biopolymer transport protein ExbB/TolQ
MLQSVIYIISSSLLYPAMAVLVYCFAAVMVNVGSFLAEWAGRSKTAEGSAERERVIRRAGTAWNQLDELLHSPEATWEDARGVWKIARLKSWKKLDYLRIIARLGPAMGLVGTLIPMSTGLAALSQGDTSRLSSDLVVAFSTTVVGLCSGVAAYVLYTVRARWAEEDLEILKTLMAQKTERALGGALEDGQ